MRDLSNYAMTALRGLEGHTSHGGPAGEPGWFWPGMDLGVTEIRELEAAGLVEVKWLPHTTGWEEPGTKRLAVKLKH